MVVVTEIPSLCGVGCGSDTAESSKRISLSSNEGAVYVVVEVAGEMDVLDGMSR